MKNPNYIRITDKNKELLVRAMLLYINKELEVNYWNKYQKQIDSPFENTGNSYSNDYMKVTAYSWELDEEKEEEPNFEVEHMQLFWYKHCFRGLEIYVEPGYDSTDAIVDILEKCIVSIKKDFEKTNE